MIIKEARFKIRQDKLNEGLELIKTFVRKVHENEPGTIIYTSYQSDDDPTSFVHFMQFKDERAEEHHRNTEYVKTFVDGLYPISEKEPEFHNLREV